MKRFVFAVLISAGLSPVVVSAQTISSVSPKTGSAGSVLTITGTGLSTASEPQVYLGDYPDELIELSSIFVSPCPVITGRNFGTSATVTIGGQPCPVISDANTTITCTVPAGSAGNLPLVVTVSGQTTQSRFSYTVP